uniref:HicA family toxin-antitoxin system n=1 Tax=Batrachochytrium dendrobatidis (strain JAM81 / FGSC 10211) TaxID=684364 RepID=F4PFS8_BATDJ|eukprot:XP_006683461.1 hypothetical protein BATDEDRAFT_28968 [Batrachochytrium dendrobatidis JAM81]
MAKNVKSVSFSLDGKEYTGDFHEDEIQWHHPHPKQDLSSKQLEWIETQVRQLLNEHDVIEDVDGIEVEPILQDHSRNAHQFKLTIDGEEFKGMIQDGNLEWFHPKPRRKIKDEHVKSVEKKVQEKMKQHLDEEL